MKKIILIIAGMFAIGIAVHAQSDSTYKSESTKSTYGHTQSKPYKVSDREVVQTSDVPESLRQTLSDERYAGWENATVYRDRVSNDYYFDLMNGDTSTQYRFDKNGKALQDGSNNYKSKSTASKSTHTTSIKKHSSKKSSQTK